MKRVLLYLISMAAISACIYPFEANLPESSEPRLVIEGSIRIGEYSDVSIGYVYPLDSYRAQIFPVIKVSVEASDGTVYNGMRGADRTYRINTSAASPDLSYRLVVRVGEKVYSSDWSTPLPAPVITGTDIWADEEQVFVTADLSAAPGTSRYIAVRFEELWNFHSDYMKLYDYNPVSNTVYMLDFPSTLLYWCWMYAENNKDILFDANKTGGKLEDVVVLSFPRSDNRNHKEYNVRIKARSLSEIEYRYLSNLETSSRNVGDLFSPEPGDVPSNIICETDASEKVYGFVNVCITVSATDKTDDAFYIRKIPGSIIDVDPENYLKFYNSGYSPVAMMVSPAGVGVGWGLPRCYDCTAAGGTLEKPAF